MDNIWNFKIELNDDGVFEKLKKHYSAPIPDELKDFIKEANASNPEKNLIQVNGEELVFETVLSFNETETEAVSVFSIIDDDQMDTAVPFGLDPFGNIFYCSLKDSRVLFYNHEEDKYEDTQYTLEEFISSLY